MINSASTIIGSAVSMVASPVNGSTYRFVIQIVQTSPGVGTCSGTININLLYKDFDSGVTYGSNNVLISLQSMVSAAGVNGSLAMTTAANGVANNWTSVPKEFRVASGTAVQYQLLENAAIGGTCTTAPIFSARPALYGPLGY
jgi:hypothetical protein